MISVETGISYSMQGMQRTRVTKEGLSVTTTITNYNIDYLIVPVYLKENFTNFYAKIGPYGAYPINAIEKWKKSVNTSGVITETPGSNIEFQKSIACDLLIKLLYDKMWALKKSLVFVFIRK